jgi:hypothetical protein
MTSHHITSHHITLNRNRNRNRDCDCDRWADPPTGTFCVLLGLPPRSRGGKVRAEKHQKLFRETTLQFQCFLQPLLSCFVLFSKFALNQRKEIYIREDE